MTQMVGPRKWRKKGSILCAQHQHQHSSSCCFRLQFSTGGRRTVRKGESYCLVENDERLAHQQLYICSRSIKQHQPYQSTKFKSLRSWIPQILVRMAESIVAFVLKQLSTLLREEYERLGGFRRDLQFIRDELESMTAFLKETEERDILETDYQLRQWVKQVREAAYDTEDLIDEFLLVFTRGRRSGFYGRVQKIYTSIKTLRARHRFSVKVTEIKQRVEDIHARHGRYKSNCGIGTSIAIEDNLVHDIRQRALLLEEDDLVGIHVPKKKLLSHILEDNSHLKVVSVVGMGGSGKTTLVRRVYEDANVKRQFHSHAWVTITKTINIELILKDLIKQLHHEIKEPIPQEVFESQDVCNLKVFLKDFLRERRYIIILDDIWSIDAWEALKYALPDGNCSSRVMLTTRIQDVSSASCNQPSGRIYRMEALSNDDSWDLFCKLSFADKRCPLLVEDVSRKILKKCEGLPLAIVSISGLLSLKDPTILDEWQKVLDSIGGELEGTGKLDRVKKILLLSYNDLPHYLKCCLLHTSLYPEDHQIDSWTLIRLWAAEGFVQDREGVSNVEIAEEYINELVNRNLLQVSERSDDGSGRCYSIHDLLREITLSRAKEHGFITAVKGWFTTEWSNARRLAMDDFIDSAQNQIQPCKHLRSLVMLSCRDSRFNLSFLKLLCAESKLLKVLHLYRSPIENIPNEVFELLHLKYLNLWECAEVKFIPKSIKNLQNLEYLYLTRTGVTELPAEILKLEKLRELHVCQFGNYANNYEVCGFRAPNEIGNLSNLQYLFWIEADNGKTVGELGKLKQLRGLGITKLRREDGKQLCSSLEKLSKLRSLSIRATNEDEILDLQYSMSTIPQFLRSVVMVGRLEKVPAWVASLQGLTTLGLGWSRLTEDQLECSQVLPNLLTLALYQAYEGKKLYLKAGAFQKLKVLRIARCKGLRCVIIEKDAMPHLRELDLMGCELLEELPQGIQNLSELQKVQLEDMPKKLIAELENGNNESENYQKIAHVPEIIIGNWENGKWSWQYL